MPGIRFELRRIHDGPGGWKRTTIVEDDYAPPTTKTCQYRNLSGALTLALNAAGESFFGVHTDNVNAALAEAIEEASATTLTTAGVDAVVCEGDDPCDISVGGFGDGAQDGATANAQILIEQGDTSGCEGAPGTIGFTGIKWSATSPGRTGWDISNLLDSMAVSSWDAEVQDEIASVIAAVEFFDGVIGGSGPWAFYSEDRAFWLFRIDASNIRFVVESPATVAVAAANYSTSADVASATSGTVITCNFTGADESPHGWPSSVTITKDGAPISVGIETDEFIPLNGGSPPDYSPGAESTYGVAGGTITIDYSGSHEVLVDPGTPHSRCYSRYTHTNRRPWQRLCETNEMQLEVDAEDGYVHPPGKFPPCRVQVKPKMPTT